MIPKTKIPSGWKGNNKHVDLVLESLEYATNRYIHTFNLKNIEEEFTKLKEEDKSGRTKDERS